MRRIEIILKVAATGRKVLGRVPEATTHEPINELFYAPTTGKRKILVVMATSSVHCTVNLLVVW